MSSSLKKVSILVAGCGGFFAGPDQYQSNFVIKSQKDDQEPKILLFDCGTDAKFSLAELKIKPTDIDAVYVSHQHGDHMGGLEWLGFSTYFSGMNKPKPKLICNQNLMEEIWETSLKGAMSTLPGRSASLSDYFDCYGVPADGWFFWDGIFFKLIQTLHIISGFSIKHSYGLLFCPAKPGKDTSFLIRSFKVGTDDVLVGSHDEISRFIRDFFGPPRPPAVLITSDCRINSPCLAEAYGQADIILHDCEMGANKSGVHPHYNDLCALGSAHTSKMYLYHCRPSDNEGAKKDGFKGILYKHQELSLW